MPTPVSSARQFLTEEAARALDDAVAVAKRRSHAQTTSLHAVSALLALPSSDLRDACARTKCSACSPRLQLKALELCVGVSLDRMPTTKNQEEPPISNSLMAAIKRSQANQRRHPETFHLYQKWHNQHNPNGSSGNSSSPPSISTVKVELKHFILSILDDPIVSRVFGDAGFRSIELKFAILNPPTISRFSKTRCPPLFLCNLNDLKLSKRGFSFPFSGALGSDNLDGDSRRIGEVLVKKSAKNPLLVGVGAKDALNDFTDAVRKGKGGVLPTEIDGLCVVCLEKDLSDFLEGARNEEMLRLKFQKVDDLVEAGQGAGVVVSFGDLKALVDGGESVEAVNFVVSHLSRLVEVHSGKLWLIGSAASYDTCMKFFAQFPTAEKDWDLHMMPFTSYKAPVAGVPSSTGLMGSFVPFGGFFSTPSDLDTSWSNRNPSAARCTICNEKYEQEASTFLKGSSTVSVAEQCSANLSPWLQIAKDKKKRLGIEEVKDDRTLLNGRLMALETKWNDICQHIHQNWPIQQNVSKVRPQYQYCGSGISIRDSIVDKRKLPDQNSCMVPSESQNTSLTKLNTSKLFPQISSADSIVESPVQQLKLGNFWNTHYAFDHVRDPLDQNTSGSVTSVTTDLGLGTLYASALKEPSNPEFQEYKDRLWNSGSVSADTSSENASNRVSQSSSCSVPPSRDQQNEKDFKSIWRVLSEKVGWQDEAVLALSQTVASCRNGCGQKHGQNSGTIWLSLRGPDKVGKRRIAAALAEALFGSAQSLLRVDLGSLGKIQCSNTILDREDLKSYGQNFRAKTMAGYVAEELSKKSESVVLLENVDKADVLVQSSLSQALKTGKFPNRGGREVVINNKVFVITSSGKGFKDFFPGNLSPDYSEERVLAATDLQMQIQIGCPSRDAVRIENTNVMITSKKGSAITLSAGKRKFADSSFKSAENMLQRMPKHMCETTRSSFDLNLPVEGTEEDDECNNSDSDSGSGSESSKGWLGDFLKQVEGNVMLKPFDFDALSQKVLKEIDASFQKVFGSGLWLEIESEVVVQILAAAWLSERKKALEEWIQDVLYRSFEAASQRCNLTPDKVMRLVACAGLVVEDHSAGICLPARISMG